MIHRTISCLVVFALFSGCMIEPDGWVDESTEALGVASVDCSGVREWAQNTTYTTGQRVTDTGALFAALVNHTAFAADWNPKRAASLWRALGTCTSGGNSGSGSDGGSGNNGGQTPPTTTPPNNGGFDAFVCLAQTGTNGGKFDPAGDFENVGNASGRQFITGRCLSNADCGSGCCAKPCGICSGPAVGNTAGKTGCGFDIRNPFAK